MFRRSFESFRKKRIYWLIPFGAIALAALLLGVIFFNKYRYFFFPMVPVIENAEAPKLLILGIDGADPDTIERLIDEGKMPNLERLMDNGVSGRPRPFIPTVSPALWTTIVTGMLPAKHGISNFFSKTENADEYTLIQSVDRRVKALWNIFDERDYTVGLFDFEASWPIEPLHGYVVADTALLDFDQAVVPSSLRDNLKAFLARIIGLERIQDGVELAFPVPKSENDFEFFRVAHEKINLYNDYVLHASRFAFQTERPQMLFQIDNVLDAAQHVFLKFERPHDYKGYIDPELQRLYGGYIDDLYIQRDKYIGEYMALADENTHIIVVSDSGFFVDSAHGYRFDQFNIILELLGLLKKHENGSIDFSQTIAFECFNNDFDWQRHLCINLEGRYKEGIVPQAEFEATRTRVLKRLESLKTANGESIYHSIGRSTGTDTDIMYDLKRTLVDEQIVIDDKVREAKQFMTLAIESGNHYANPLGPPAFFAWMGPGIRKGVRLGERLELQDITPNILHAFGLPIGRDMDGKYLPELFVDKTPPEYIDSYESDTNRLFSGVHELVGEGDVISVDGASIGVFASLDESQPYKTFCFQVPSSRESHALQIDSARGTTETGIGFDPGGNPQLDHDLSYVREISFMDLPRTEVQVFLPRDFEPESGSEELYAIQQSLDATKNAYFAMWTNMYFTVRVRTAGTLRVFAAGNSINGEPPILEVYMQDKLIDTIQVDGESFKPYDVAIPQPGVIRIAYTNDAISGGQDRNAFVEQMKFSEHSFYQPTSPFDLYFENSQLCLHDAFKGTVDIRAKLINAHDENRGDLGQNRILDIWQDIGEIK